MTLTVRQNVNSAYFGAELGVNLTYTEDSRYRKRYFVSAGVQITLASISLSEAGDNNASNLGVLFTVPENPGNPKGWPLYQALGLLIDALEASTGWENIYLSRSKQTESEVRLNLTPAVQALLTVGDVGIG